MLVQKALSVWDRRNRALQTEVANEAIVLGFSKTRRDGEEEDERRRDESRERKVAIYSARNERARSGFLRRRRRKGEGSDK